ncbi:MAG: class I SAM-dependent methyltransferase [Pseudomonadota bacterium]
MEQSAKENQHSSLLAPLFEHTDLDQRLTVLNIGPALPETVTFFSQYRCRLYFEDLFSELPALHRRHAEPDEEIEAKRQFIESMRFPDDTRFDLCLFWDLFNFLDRDVLSAVLDVLQPHLHPGSQAHGFAVHNLRTEQSGKIYGLRSIDQISMRSRGAKLPGYNPYNRGQLEKLLTCFKVVRSVLLPSSRLEFLLAARL